MHFFKFQSYLWKVLSTIGIVSFVFLLIMVSTLAYYMVIPLGHRATDDLASIMFHAAERWDHTSTAAGRRDFTVKMRQKHDLVLTGAEVSLPPSTSMLPYLYFLETSLSKQMGAAITIKSSRDSDDKEWFWVDIPITDEILRFGFSRERIGVKPSIAFFVVLITSVYLTVITAIILTRRLTVPVDRLYRAAQLGGKGQWPEPVQEEGPEELIVLARGFNRMNIQVKELLANRTTLLAGIAHDLRTPLTQIQLALSMLPDEGGDRELMASIHSDLEVINRLIGETLSISLELAEEEVLATDIDLELDTIIKNIQTNGVAIEWSRGQPCYRMLQPLALRRIVTNLLTNALRYGEGKPVTVSYECRKDATIIRISDRGPGIPAEHIEAVFRPFFRLEKSRGSETGGSGLGLAIVRQLADAHGWSVKLLPRAGAGTEAVLTIPGNQ
ncbi:MAG: ATP-binding protein [Gammaproteobacteria bacterium]|nr:ATP-binding protein [Gammaproteobacteria bacterium]